MKKISAIAILLASIAASPAVAATAFDLEGVTPGAFNAITVTDGGLTLVITTTTGDPVWVGNLSNPALLGKVGAVGNNGTPFAPLRFSFSAPVDQITFNFGDIGGDDDSPVLIQAFSAGDVLLGSANDTYPAGLDTGKSLTLSFAGASYYIASSGSAQGNVNSLVWDIGAITPAAGAVPEPASWALMIAGFGAMGGALRSRRKVAASFA
ncbi:MAG: PEPxxWA-CTERM sorting domain-containing protein [Sphingobium sp.]|nr:PEPxxWA-CTERM sorting domain-containing protein [Sphingobium sp.]